MVKQNHLALGVARRKLTNIRLRMMVQRKLPNETFTYDQIAKFCKFTKERIRQIENEALKKIRTKDTAIWKEWKKSNY